MSSTSMNRRVGGLAIVLIGASLGACSSGPGVAPPPAATSVPRGQGSSADATVSLTIPVRAPANDRRAAYVSANAQSIGIAIAAGTASPGPATVANVTPGSPNCTSGSSGTTCIVAVAAPVGGDTFSVSLYAGANATGSVLATASLQSTINAGAANHVAITLGGVVASVALALPATPAAGGTPTTLPLTVVAKDASGATIVGSDPFAAPIALTDSDTSGSTTLSTTSVTSPATAVTLAYTGSYVSTAVTISASVPNVAASNITPAAFLNTATHLYVGDHASANVYVFPAQGNGPLTPAALISTHQNALGATNGSVVAGLTLDAAGLISVLYNYTDTANPGGTSEIATFAAGSNAVTTPLRTLGGVATLLDYGSSDITVDGSGKLYVDGSGTGTILVFPKGATGNAAPSYQINANAGGVAATATGQLVASDRVPSPAPTAQLQIFAPNAQGSAAPIASLNVLTNVVALDPANNIYAGDSATHGVTEYALNGSSLSAVRTVTNALLTNPQPVAVDQAGYLYVANEGGDDTIYVFDPKATGAATPIRIITANLSPSSLPSMVPGTIAVGP